MSESIGRTAPESRNFTPESKNAAEQLRIENGKARNRQLISDVTQRLRGDDHLVYERPVSPGLSPEEVKISDYQLYLMVKDPANLIPSDDPSRVEGLPFDKSNMRDLLVLMGPETRGKAFDLLNLTSSSEAFPKPDREQASLRQTEIIETLEEAIADIRTNGSRYKDPEALAQSLQKWIDERKPTLPPLKLASDIAEPSVPHPKDQAKPGAAEQLPIKSGEERNRQLISEVTQDLLGNDELLSELSYPESTLRLIDKRKENGKPEIEPSDLASIIIDPTREIPKDDPSRVEGLPFDKTAMRDLLVLMGPETRSRVFEVLQNVSLNIRLGQPLREQASLRQTEIIETLEEAIADIRTNGSRYKDPEALAQSLQKWIDERKPTLPPQPIIEKPESSVTQEPAERLLGIVEFDPEGINIQQARSILEQASTIVSSTADIDTSAAKKSLTDALQKAIKEKNFTPTSAFSRAITNYFSSLSGLTDTQIRDSLSIQIKTWEMLGLDDTVPGLKQEIETYKKVINAQ